MRVMAIAATERKRPRNRPYRPQILRWSWFLLALLELILYCTTSQNDVEKLRFFEEYLPCTFASSMPGLCVCPNPGRLRMSIGMNQPGPWWFCW